MTKAAKVLSSNGEGKIATNFHLVDAASRIKVTMLSGDVFLGKVVRTDPNRDLALVQIATKTTSYLQLGDSSSVDVGEEVYVVVGISTARTGQPADENTGFAVSVTELKAFVFGQ